jgi:hypothetical protein
MTDPDFLKRRCEALGEINVKVDVDRTDDTIEVRISRDVKRNLPSFAKRIFKPVNHVDEVQIWKISGDTMSCTADIDVVGTNAVKIREEWTLAPAGDSCDFAHTAIVKASYPLIGKRIEKYVVGQMESSIKDQVDFTKRELT